MRRWIQIVVFCLSYLAVSIASLADEAPPKKLACSTTQIADFARQIVGDRWKVNCVLAPGQDPHLYQTKPSDVRLVEAADLCLANGWHLEGGDWMQKLADDAGKPLVICVENVKPLVLEASGQEVHDPHAWFTPKNARIYVLNVLRGVSRIDPRHEAEYKLRAELYLRQLQTLNAWILKQVNSIPAPQRVLVTSHDAFGYFCNEYGFRGAAPAGWSTGAEVGGGITPARRQRTVDSIREFGVKSIFVETSVNKKLIREIASEAGVEIGGELYSDSMGRAGSAGETYIGMMRENVLQIVQGLR
jgi:manganese/iron transport system substrate-binding protein